MEEDYPHNGKQYFDINRHDYMPEPLWQNKKPQTREEFFSRFTIVPDEDLSEEAKRFKEWLHGGPEKDMVNSPKHYRLFPNMEVIDIIETVLTKKEFIGYLKGNALKYRLRAGHKDNTEQDIEKAKWYEAELSAIYEVDDE